MSEQERVFRALLQACEQDGAVLVTLIGATGSTPREAGACMAVDAQGRCTGTIGGGLLEHEACGAARAHLLEKRSGTSRFDLSAGGDGMVCGGDAQVLYTYLPPTEDTLRTIGLAVASMETATPGKLVLPLAGGAGFVNAHGEVIGLTGPLPDGIAAANGLACNGFFVLPLGETGTVHIIGGGHLAQALAYLLPWLGFSYDVADDRAQYADPQRFPDAKKVRLLSYTDLGGIDVGPEDCIVIVTDGHKGDYEAEKWALRTPAAYIGVVGSSRKTAYVNGLLTQDGFTEADLARVAAPIGIPIGSDTPAEIAVSIAAQLVQHRSQERNGRKSRK